MNDEMENIAIRKPKPQVEAMNYCDGGFHPVHLGDRLKSGRYEIIHKLGHGGFGTVWLARDSKRNRYVALKILAAGLSKKCPEVNILRHLKAGPEHRGKPHVMLMLDHFWKNGPNGNHLCVISEVGGPSIKQFNECPGEVKGSRRLKSVVARRVALQALEGLSYIHSVGLVHGDFTSTNILLRLANIDQWTIEQVYERLGEHEKHDIQQTQTKPNDSDSFPRYTVTAIDMNLVHPRWLSDQIMIIDFGISFLQEEPSSDIGTPKSYWAPEFLFKGERSIASDIWALGCTIFEIRTGVRLFTYHSPPTMDEALIATIKVVGDLPQEFWNKWKQGQQWYAEARQSGALTGATGQLLQRIMQTGTHDGDRPSSDPQQNERLDDHHHSRSRNSKKTSGTGSFDRYIHAMVDAITTSDAKELLDMADNSKSSSDNDKQSPKSNENPTDDRKISSSLAIRSGPRQKNNPDSDNSKSTGKEISSGAMSSEGIATGPSGPANSKHRNAVGASENIATRLSPAATNRHVSEDTEMKEAKRTSDTSDDIVRPISPDIVDFVEPAGTRISGIEAKSLESLLRKALKYLPEERSSALELGNHTWFSDDFGDHGMVEPSNSSPCFA